MSELFFVQTNKKIPAILCVLPEFFVRYGRKSAGQSRCSTVLCRPVEILVLAHVHLSGDFGCEVLFLLLDALALCETDSVNELDGAA